MAKMFRARSMARRVAMSVVTFLLCATVLMLVLPSTTMVGEQMAGDERSLLMAIDDGMMEDDAIAPAPIILPPVDQATPSRFVKLAEAELLDQTTGTISTANDEPTKMTTPPSPNVVFIRAKELEPNNDTDALIPTPMVPGNTEDTDGAINEEVVDDPNTVVYSHKHQNKVGRQPITGDTTNNSNKSSSSKVAMVIDVRADPSLDLSVSDLNDDFGDLRNKTPRQVAYPNQKEALVDQLDIYPDDAPEAWKHFHSGITKNRLYDPEDPWIEKLLDELQTQPIVGFDTTSKGTYLKVIMQLENGGRAFAKPRRWSREAISPDDEFFFMQIERHNAEIAAYHVDRVLDFQLVPPTATRTINIVQDLAHFADIAFNNTIYKSPAGNWCFYGLCSYRCDVQSAACGEGELIEVSMQAMLPGDDVVKREPLKAPWSQAYAIRQVDKPAAYESDPYFCERIVPYAGQSRIMLDMIDLAIFDFIIDNEDRHHYETFKIFAQESPIIRLDHGLALGSPYRDHMGALAPLTQCCLIRYSTLQKLLRFVGEDSQKLSEAFIESSKKDAGYPLLLDDFHRALDRRLITVLKQVRKCLESELFEDVVLDDGL